MIDTKQIRLATALCVALVGLTAVPAIATEPDSAVAAAAQTYKVTVSGMT